MKHRRLVLSCGIWLSVFGSSGLFLATRVADASPATEFRYQFREGVAALKRGDLQTALDRFFLANRAAPNPNTIRNIALSLEKLGRLHEAFTFYQELASFPNVDAENKKFAQKAIARLQSKVARVLVQTNPPGAFLYVDRRSLGQYGSTPVVVALAPGRHTLILEKKGYHGTKTSVSMTIGRLVRVQSTLRLIAGAISVRTRPKQADVLVDDDTAAPVGRSPIILRLSPGPHVIFVRKSGYLGQTRRVVVNAEERRRIEIVLRPKPTQTGTLSIMSNVMGAVVTIDQRPVGMTPFFRTDIPVGTHVIAVADPGRLSWHGPVTIRRKGRVTVMVQLERRPTRTSFGPWPWVGLGVATATLVAGITLAGLSHKNYLDFEHADAPTMDSLHRGQKLAIAADSVLGTFLVSGIATAVAFILLRPQPWHPSRARVQQDPTKQFPSLHDGSFDDVSPNDGSSHGASLHDGSSHDVSLHDGSSDDVSPNDGSPDRSVGHNTAEHRVTDHGLPHAGRHGSRK